MNFVLSVFRLIWSYTQYFLPKLGDVKDDIIMKTDSIFAHPRYSLRAIITNSVAQEHPTIWRCISFACFSVDLSSEMESQLMGSEFPINCSNFFSCLMENKVFRSPSSSCSLLYELLFEELKLILSHPSHSHQPKYVHSGSRWALALPSLDALQGCGGCAAVRLWLPIIAAHAISARSAD